MGPSAERREEREPADDHDHADSSPANRGVCVGNVPAGGGHLVACGPAIPAIASTGMISRKRPTSIAMPNVVLIQSVFGGDAGERGAVVVRAPT